MMKKISKCVAVYVIGIGMVAVAMHYIDYVVDKIRKKEIEETTDFKKVEMAKMIVTINENGRLETKVE